MTVKIDEYDVHGAMNYVEEFLESLANWYVRRSRRRFWKSENDDDKNEAYHTLYHVLVEVCKLIAPVAPYLSDEIYMNLTGKGSVHLDDYPIVNKNVIDTKLEEEMDSVIKLVSLGRAARNTCQIKVRQTLGGLYVPEKYKPLIARMEDLIKEEINVKEIKYIADKDSFVTYEFKANFKVMGPKYGKHIKRIVTALEQMDANHIVETLHKNNEYYLEMDGSTFKLTEEDLSISIKDFDSNMMKSLNYLLMVNMALIHCLHGVYNVLEKMLL